MPRHRRPTAPEIAARLVAVKMMVKGTRDAMPRLAEEMRREACETIDDIIQDVGVLSGGR